VPKAVINYLPNDMAACREVIDHNLRIYLVKAGSKKYQNEEHPFGCTTRTIKVTESTKKS